MVNLGTMTLCKVAKAIVAVGLDAEMSGKGKDWQMVVETREDMESVMARFDGVTGFRAGDGRWHLRPDWNPVRIDINNDQ